MSATIFCEACGTQLDAVPRRRGRCNAILCAECREQARGRVDEDGYIEDDWRMRPEPEDLSNQVGSGWSL